MSAHTERRLDGHKLFVHNEDETIVVHAVSDGRPLTRMVFEMDAEDARALLIELSDAIECVTH